jgi:hypothetical protein
MSNNTLYFVGSNSMATGEGMTQAVLVTRAYPKSTAGNLKWHSQLHINYS